MAAAVHADKKRSGIHVGDPSIRKEEAGSELRMWLLEQFAWGLLSTMQVQKIAELAVLDARSVKILDLDTLGNSGNCGKHVAQLWC